MVLEYFSGIEPSSEVLKTQISLKILIRYIRIKVPMFWYFIKLLTTASNNKILRSPTLSNNCKHEIHCTYCAKENTFPLKPARDPKIQRPP